MGTMWMFLLVVIATAFAKNSYVVIAPSKIRPSMNFAISVNILDAAGDVSVAATIRGGSTVVASGIKIFKGGSADTIDVVIPSGLEDIQHTLTVKGTGGLTFEHSQDLSINKKEASVFIQLIKAIFKPGDTVSFRAFATNSDLKLYNAPMNISVYDADSNKIKQWLQATPDNGVLSQELTLSTQPTLGDWKITVEMGRTKAEKTFTVAEYVLPTFEVNVVMPSYILTSDSDVTFTVKSKYTYGKPVKGTANILVKLLESNNANDYSKAISGITVQVPIDGEAKVSVPMSQIRTLSTPDNEDLLIITANVTDSITGNQMSGNGSVRIYTEGVQLEYPEYNPKSFKPGLQYIAYLKVTQPDGLPVSSKTDAVKITISVTPKVGNVPYWQKKWYWDEIDENIISDYTLFIPDSGLISIPVQVPSYSIKLQIKAVYKDISQELSVERSHSPSNSYIQILLKTSPPIQAGNDIIFEVKSTNVLTKLVYQILSRGAIVKVGSINTNNQLVNTLSVSSDPSMAPTSRIVLYGVGVDGEIITDSISFDIKGLFKNKVSINLDRSEAEPGNNVIVNVQADPESTAHILAIDQSVLLLKAGNDVTADDVNSDLLGYDSKNNDDTSKKRTFWGRWRYPLSSSGSDAWNTFETAGVVVLTDAMVYRYEEPFLEDDNWPWDRFSEDIFLRSGDVSFDGSDQLRLVNSRERVNNPSEKIPPTSPSLMEAPRVRIEFPEAWLWNQLPIGSNGSASMSATVPDTITSWVAGAFAVNSMSGLGIATDQVNLTVFRPFFVNLNLPYSVTRGEQLALQVNVFNYMEEEMLVRVTLTKSESFNVIDSSGMAEDIKGTGSVQNILVKAGEAKSVYFHIVPTKLGKIDVEVKGQSTKAADAIRRQLLVEAEGVKKEYNIPVFIDLTNGKSSFSDIIDLPLPKDTVQGSKLVRISAMGDIMGPTIAGIDTLITLPHGCGEQTMIYLAPDVYITNYLKTVNKLSVEIKAKAISFMESGYQRELTYKHTDGSFSAFGMNDGSGSMWLTAFVAKVLHQAKPYIFVDDSVLITAVDWMISKQHSNGSFPEPGRVLNKEMQGEGGSGLGLTLFVLISLLENKDLPYPKEKSDSVLLARQKALNYAEREVGKTDDLYFLCMAAYAFHLAGSTQTQAVLNKLQQKATIKDGKKFWQIVDTIKEPSNNWGKPKVAKSVDIEMTSYVLLTYAARGDIVAGKQILNWIIDQRNSNGGFVSTQDTVVALHALSEFAKMTYTDNFNIQVITQLNPTTSYTFNIDNSNSLLFQSRETSDVPSKVKIDARGSGIALVQLSVFFNVETEIEATTFELTILLVEEEINYLLLKTCTRWLGQGPSSGMAVQEIGIPSGFEADIQSISQIKIIKRVETQNKKIILYFDQIEVTTTCVNIRVTRVNFVVKIQPAAVRVYDYYEPRNQVTVFYESLVLRTATLCEVCKECTNCP
ncbi:unnamed protein product [Lymnaea stagnalis]|uniref:CD109 antigen n=1 Tax=Lymnaea stagnalis TaxID=6523 RepID=A0AAV2INL6_LYMST